MKKAIEILINRSEITAGTRGASLGPDAIRVAARSKKSSFFSSYKLQELTDYNSALDLPTPFHHARYIDAYSKVFEEVSGSVKKELLNDVVPVILSGDHGSGAATIAGIKKAFPTKRLGVIWIDAHGDLHTPYTTPSGNMHGMPLALALGDDNHECSINEPTKQETEYWEALKVQFEGNYLQSEDLVFIALRDTEVQEDKLIERRKITSVTVDELQSKGPALTAKSILNEVLEKCDLIYVSFDVDSMDPQLTSFGTGTPVKNGLTPQESKELLTALCSDERICCVEFVEVNPCLDNQMNRMAEVAFELIEETIKVIVGN